MNKIERSFVLKSEETKDIDSILLGSFVYFTKNRISVKKDQIYLVRAIDIGNNRIAEIAEIEDVEPLVLIGSSNKDIGQMS